MLIVLLTALLFQSTYTVTLAWDANTEPNLAGYHVYRGTVGGTLNWQRLTTAPTTETTFTDTSPTRLESYIYSVTAVDTDGFESAISEVVRANAPLPVFPSRPGGVTIIIVTGQ